jgi:uncharacterized protein YhaN
MESLHGSITALEAANVELGIFKGRAAQLEAELQSSHRQLSQCRVALDEAREQILLSEADRQNAISCMENAETKCCHAISSNKLAWEKLAQEHCSHLSVVAQRDEALEKLRKHQASVESVWLW